MKKWLKAFGKGVSYIGIFIGTQVMVSMIVVILMLVSLITNMQSISAMEQLNAVELQTILVDKVLGVAVEVTIVSDILAVVIVAILFKVRDRKMKFEINLMPINKRTIPILCLIGISFNILISSVLDCLLGGSSIMESYNQSSSILLGVNVLSFLAIVIVAPLTEEIFCRGLMLNRFQKGMSITAAIVLQAFFFGLMHGDPLWIAYTMVVGVILGVIANQQESIVSTIIVHITFNLTSFLMTAFDVQMQGMTVNVIMIVVSIIVFIGLLALLFKKFQIKLPQEDEPETLELANLGIEELVIGTKFYE